MIRARWSGREGGCTASERGLGFAGVDSRHRAGNENPLARLLFRGERSAGWEGMGVRDTPQRMLMRTLRQLERDGLVLRQDFEETPPRVEYELSDTGMDLLVRMAPLWTWIVENADRFREARRDFDGRHRDADA
jgi:DNA-binding HxlR family transcriptional regulator